MAPCKAVTVEECMTYLGLNDTQTEDIELLCEKKDEVWFEVISSDTVAIIMYLITNIYIQTAECSLALKKKSHIFWSEDNTSQNYEKGRKAIVGLALVHCIIGFVVYMCTGFLIYHLSDPLDNRANSIVLGVTQLFSGFIFLILSIQISQWFGIYHSNKDKHNTIISFASEKEIKFHLSWNIWNLLLSMFFFHLYFSSADVGLYGALIGFPCSFLVVYILMLARSKKYKKHKGQLCIAIVIIFGSGSWGVVATGISYIADVWRHENLTRIDVFGYSIIWVLFGIGCHVILYFWTRYKQSKGISIRFKSQLFRPSNLVGSSTSVASQKIETKVKDEEEGINNNNEKVNQEEVVMKPQSDSPDKEGQEEKDEQTSCHIDEVNGSNNGVHNNNNSDDNDDDNDNDNDNENKLVSHGDPNATPSYWKLFMKKTVDTSPFICGCCVKEEKYVTERQPKSSADKILDCIKRFVCYVVSFLFLLATIINIGASYEQCKAKTALPITFRKLYPADYTTGTMCAWDKNGPPGPNTTIKEFETVKDVKDANYEIIHCGACGNCSNWNDIQLQYTSREVLASITKKCTQESFGRKVNPTDDSDELVQCNHLQVGFTIPCAKAWAWDENHTKKYAVFTFLQAQFTQSFADMEVSFTDITMATIDEAISGPEFVPRVGATRRRMNIIGDIQRPKYQQCTAAQQNWAEIFTDPFYPPVGGTYVVQKPNTPSMDCVIVGQDDSS